MGDFLMLHPGMPRAAAPKTTHGRNKGLEKVFAGLEYRMKITYRVDPREMLSKRNLNKHMRAINRSMMLFWHKYIRPDHFTKKGQRKYQYQRRTNATMVIKREQFGHGLPIVAKGIARSLTSNIKSLRSTPTTANLTMYGPWYLDQQVKRRRGGMSPDLKAELTRVTDTDAMDMAELGSSLIAKRLEQDKRRRLGAHTITGGIPVNTP